MKNPFKKMKQPLLGEAIKLHTMEAIIYTKDHLRQIYAACKKAGKMSQPPKDFKLLDMPVHRKQNRLYVKDLHTIMHIIGTSRAELYFFNSYLEDNRFKGYCYSHELRKLLRVWKKKFYEVVMEHDINVLFDKNYKSKEQ